jgi:hypothetical protein
MFAIADIAAEDAGAALGASFEAVEFATLEWVDWFNNRRLLTLS